MKKQLPCAHQHGDAVNLYFGDAGTLHNAKITKVSFDPGKVFYDAEIEIKPGMSTRLRMIDSAFVEKVIYTYTFRSSRSIDFLVDETYFIYKDHDTMIGKNGCSDDPKDYPKVKYKGYNATHGVSIFESTFLLDESILYLVPVPITLPDNTVTKLIYNVTFNQPTGSKLPLPDNGNFDFEYTPIFSIIDIEKIFDAERRDHGSNPMDSINRMYRKLLALKEKGV